jgi:hypothetical protein
VLAYEIPWAAIGACLARAGPFLFGFAALRLARRPKKEEVTDEAPGDRGDFVD